jgi:sugar (pentulose or hexulose) kinase
MADDIENEDNDALTLVIDIGKSHAKLLLVDAAGRVVQRHERDNASVPSALGYPALDLVGLGQWVTRCLRESAYTRHCTRVMPCTHGAALVALGHNGLAWEPLDYEFDGYEPIAQDYAQQRDGFAHTLSPDLPAGLNIARQLYWLQHRHPAAWARTRCLLPYAQYWAWWFSGVAASECSSLGCHTQLWQPQAGAFSNLAQAQGWAALFAPLRKAWEVLGPVRPDLAQALGLPARCEVLVGVHDSNACLARYLNAPVAGAGAATALTVVSSGTWTVLMAPGAPTRLLEPGRDMLGNVDVLGRATPTARFMGGREFAALLDGAAPHAATLADVQALIASHTFAMPSFASQGGPFMGREGWVETGNGGHGDHGAGQGASRLAWPLSQSLPAGQRAALAALYCAQTTAWLVQRLWGDAVQTAQTVIVEGPLAHNPLYLAVLQALLPQHHCQFSTDAMEGTARGAWALSQWAKPTGPQFLSPTDALPLPGLADYQAAWLARVMGG